MLSLIVVSDRSPIIMAAPWPRVAIVGGGISAACAAMALSARNIQPVVFEAGKRLGGRLHASEFLRASDGSRFGNLLTFLASINCVEPWHGRFGVVGTRTKVITQDSFLPKEHFGRATGGTAQSEDKGLRDSGDFCNFIQSKDQLYLNTSRTDDGGSIVSKLLTMANAQVYMNAKVTNMALETGNVLAQSLSWGVDVEIGENSDGRGAVETQRKQNFDAVIIAAHNPWMAASTIAANALGEDNSSDSISSLDLSDPVKQRLAELVDSLASLRMHKCLPVAVVKKYFPQGTLDGIPFDAATILGSSKLQFMSRGQTLLLNQVGDYPFLSNIKDHNKTLDGELWTAVSTTAFAEKLLADNSTINPQEINNIIGDKLGPALEEIIMGFSENKNATSAFTEAKMWKAGLTDGTLESWSMFDEDSIVLEPLYLALAGDYIRRHGSPFEAAALSGMEAGERLGDLLNPQQ